MKQDRLWAYAVLPAVVLNLGLLIVIVTYFGLAATQPALVAGFSQSQLSFVLSLFVCIVEWVFAISIIRRLNLAGARQLLAQSNSLWGFKWLRALLAFVTINAIFATYVAYTIWGNGSWYRIEGLSAWQIAVMLAFVPITAGFCEELIWRGFIVTRLEARGYKLPAAIALSAVSFALIHGIWLPDKLLATFLIGLVAAFYYTQERNLLPLVMTHVVMDVWSFGLSVL